MQGKILSARDNEASPDTDLEPHLPLPSLRYAVVEGWITEGRLSSKIGANDDYGCERLRVLEMHSSEGRVMGPRKSLRSASTPLWKAST